MIKHVSTELVVEADDVYTAMGKIPGAIIERYGRRVNFSIVKIEQDATDINDDSGPVRVTAIARP